MEKKSKENKISLLVTILLLILITLLLAEYMQLSEIKDRVSKTQVFWNTFKQDTKNETTEVACQPYKEETIT